MAPKSYVVVALLGLVLAIVTNVQSHPTPSLRSTFLPLDTIVSASVAVAVISRVGSGTNPDINVGLMGSGNSNLIVIGGFTSGFPYYSAFTNCSQGCQLHHKDHSHGWPNVRDGCEYTFEIMRNATTLSVWQKGHNDKKAWVPTDEHQAHLEIGPYSPQISSLTVSFSGTGSKDRATDMDEAAAIQSKKTHLAKLDKATSRRDEED